MYKPNSIFVEIALKSILSEFNINYRIEHSDTVEELMEKRACFVTLHKGKELRGCIGTMIPYRKNLFEEIKGNAISSAFSDPRFPPLKKDELEKIQISVDILSPLEEVEDIGELDPKKYGILVSNGRNQGVLLPDLDGVDSVEEQINIAMNKARIFTRDGLFIKKFTVKRYR